MKTSTAVILSLLSILSLLILHADPVPGRALVLTDGSNFYPTGSVPSKATVETLSARVDQLSDSVQEDVDATSIALQQAQQALDSVAFVAASNIVTVTAYIGSIDASAVATNQTVSIVLLTTTGTPVTSLHLVALFSAPQTQAPLLDWRLTLSDNGASSNAWTSAEGVTCSWPTESSETAVPPGYFAYSFDVPVNAAAHPQAFFRVVARTSGGGGSGWYQLVYNFIAINGRPGRTLSVISDDLEQLDFVGGVLVEAVQ